MSNIIHVSPTGDDANVGTFEHPLQSVQAAADRATPGDIVEVHAGTYREWINPRRGGTSAQQRITFRAAKGEQVILSGSEIVTDWHQGDDGLWRVELFDQLFTEASQAGFHPFRSVLEGDWFHDNGRQHHLGEVFCDGIALREASRVGGTCKSTDK